MANALEDETPAARLKQVALMTVIIVERLHLTASPITLAQLVEMTGLARNVAVQAIDAIVQRGILVESWGKNSMGRGTARQFQIAPAVLQHIASFMGASLNKAEVKPNTP